MCSIGNELENGSEKYMPHIDKTQVDKQKCNKCKVATPCILLRGKDSYCKPCFLLNTNHKFKLLLGKSKLIRPRDKVLVVYEIGHPSTALLHLIRDGLNLNTPKKLTFDPVFLFVDDQYHLSLSERKDVVSNILTEAANHEFKIKFLSFVDWVLYNRIILSDNSDYIKADDGDKIVSLFSKKTNETNRKEFFNIEKKNALIAVAKQLECKFIFKPDISVDVASNLLINISLGKGSQISMDTGFCDDRDDYIKILSPLRLFDMKELAFYNLLNKLNPVSIRQLKIDPYSSAQNLLKKFVTELQEGYPATVTTVVKTGDKLVSDIKILGKCKLCKGPVFKNSELNSEESTHFSKLVSTYLPDRDMSKQDRFDDIKKTFESTVYMTPQHCYSCSKISEFLLDDGSD